MQSASTAWKITTIQALAVVFVSVIAVEVGVATSSTANYFQFYKALAEMQVRLALEVGPLQGDQSANSNVTAVFSIENPTGYDSMIMRALGASFRVVNSTNDNQIQGSTGLDSGSPPTALNPNVVENVTINFHMLLPAANYKFLFTVTLDLSTFLDTLSLLQSSFSCDTSQSQGCTLVSITPHSIGLPGGGGGL